MLLAASLLLLPPGGAAASTGEATPRVSTGAVAHPLVSSAELTAAVDPEGSPASCYFQFGPTTAYGSQTAAVPLGSGVTRVKVGETAEGLQQGALYHYRAVVVYDGARVVYGQDRTFVLEPVKPKIEIERIGQVVVNSSFVLSGTLTGAGNANRMVELQASPYPYLAPFATIGPAAVTNTEGRFAFRIAKLAASTEFRVITLEASPLYSPVVKVGGALRVSFHARSGAGGLVRLYGTISPAAAGAPVYIQLQRPAGPRARASEGGTLFVTQFTSTVKRGTSNVSRFSLVVRPRRSGRYRAYVALRPGRLASGYSTQTIFLRAAAKR